MVGDFDKYYEAVEPGRRERASAWATAIGLQDVDGLKPSRYLLAAARRNIEGEISADEVRRLVDAYYEVKEDHDVPADAEEADKVAVRINQIIHTPSFRLSPEFLLGLHGKIFEGVFPYAGQIRTVDLTKKEWVLNGDTVSYAPSFLVKDSLAYDFDRERAFSYKGLSEDAFVRHFAAFVSGVWQIHPFREGNTRTTALFAIKYLQSLRYRVTNALFAEKSWFFRNALVRANYENPQLDVSREPGHLEDFFRVLLFDESIELKNRYLRIGAGYGSSIANAMTKGEAGLVQQSRDVGINVGINGVEAAAMKLLRQNPKITAAQLGETLAVGKRQAERIVAALKRKAGLRRRGARKNGEWYFTPLKTTARKDAASAYEPKNDPLNDPIKPKEKDK